MWYPCGRAPRKGGDDGPWCGREGGYELREYARAPLPGRVASLGDQAELGEKGNGVVMWAVGVRDLDTRGRWIGARTKVQGGGGGGG
jgi:hypothetical protein